MDHELVIIYKLNTHIVFIRIDTPLFQASKICFVLKGPVYHSLSCIKEPAVPSLTHGC
jgi:hypothetical protein